MSIVPLPAYVAKLNSEEARKAVLKDYRVTFEDGSTHVVELARNKTEARKVANKYLTDYCGYFGRHAGPRPCITSIDLL